MHEYDILFRANTTDEFVSVVGDYIMGDNPDEALEHYLDTQAAVVGDFNRLRKGGYGVYGPIDGEGKMRFYKVSAPTGFKITRIS